MKRISIRRDAVRSAAVWIKTNNPHMRNKVISYLEYCIWKHVNEIIEVALEHWEIMYTGGAGWTILFTPEDEEYGTIEILVDPQVGEEPDYNYVYQEGVEVV